MCAGKDAGMGESMAVWRGILEELLPGRMPANGSDVFLQGSWVMEGVGVRREA